MIHEIIFGMSLPAVWHSGCDPDINPIAKLEENFECPCLRDIPNMRA